jgi:hypothetical protein
MASKDLRTIKQIVEARPGFTEPAIRGLIFRAAENGLDHALVRIGRRVLIDLARFDVWLEAQRVA